MPRKQYVRKCVYCRRTKLDNREFEHVLWCWLTGVPAVEASTVLKQVKPPIDIHEKSIRRHYRLIGEKLHDKYSALLYEPDTRWKIDPLDLFSEVSALEDEASRLEAKRNLTYKMWHELWTHPENDPLVNDSLVGSIMRQHLDLPFEDLDVAVMYRELSKRKRGIDDSIRENLVLAIVRSTVRFNMRENKTKGWSLSERAEIAMFESIKAELRLNPC